MLDKLFGWTRKKDETQAGPDIPFGRYSDNNKPVAKVNRWTDADNLFKDKKYDESIDAFFDYLRDEATNNVVYERNGAEGRFELIQGSKIVRGRINNQHVQAEVVLAKMPDSSVPVMRRLLEMNFALYYSRFALDDERLCMRFDAELHSASPSKLYYGLKELAIKSDKQDDLLVHDFTILEKLDTDHIENIPEEEKEIKFRFFQQWIRETTELIATLDPDKFSGGIAYMLLALAYRIDYLVCPEGRLLHDLEKIAGIYFKKDDRPVTEKNRDMVEEFKKLLTKSKDEIFGYLFRSRYTFSIVSPQQYKMVADSIRTTNGNVAWYRDNNYPQIATKVTEYGISYCQYSYSLPRPLTLLFHLFMMINYPDFFEALGFKNLYYDPSTKQFNSLSITERIREIQDEWKEKYPHMDFKVENLKFDNLVNFDYSFTTELEYLNMDSK